jgi:glutamate-ammonia-ligase adenylyltransferase
MGKLGGEELNYSSDVDLIYVLDAVPHDGDPTQIGGPRGTTPIEHFSRVAHEFGRLVTEPTREGFLYRIDLDLRRKTLSPLASRTSC